MILEFSATAQKIIYDLDLESVRDGEQRGEKTSLTAAHHLCLSSLRNQVCVAKETSAKLPAMTEQREPFCFIDCSSSLLVQCESCLSNS